MAGINFIGYSEEELRQDNTRVTKPPIRYKVPVYRPNKPSSKQETADKQNTDKQKLEQKYYSGQYGFKPKYNIKWADSESKEARNNIVNGNTKYHIPYVKDKEITFSVGRFNTGKISTNVLDSLYNSAQRIGIPFVEALGLAGRESGVGYARGFKENGKISGTDLMSNWQQVQPVYNTNKDIKRFKSLITKDTYTDEEQAFIDRYLQNVNREIQNTRELTENPIDNALRYYLQGNYNPGDPKYNERIKQEGQLLMTDPAVIKWLKERNK